MDEQVHRRRQAAWIYVLPALVDMALALVLFVGTVRAVKLGGDATRAAAVLAVWSLVYVVACPLVGRRVTAGNARRFLLAGCGLLALSCGLLALSAGLGAMLVWVGVCAVACALFFPAFQVFMKDVDSAGGRSAAYSTGLYTFSWSTGFACGPFVAGFLMKLGAPSEAGGEGPGWRYAFLFGAAVCLLMSAGVAWAFRHQAGRSIAAARPPDAPASACYESRPDLAWLGWVGAGAGFVALAIVRAIFPVRAMGAPVNLAEGALGSVFFMLSMAQALMGLALMRSRFWMYRARPVAAFAAAGVGGILCFGFGGTLAVFLVGAALFGVYTGAFCFYMVFHAIVHPRRAGHYVAINESLVGITGFVAPLAAGAMSDAWGLHVPYLAAVALTVAVTLFQVRVHRNGEG
jgi:MFS family permease